MKVRSLLPLALAFVVGAGPASADTNTETRLAADDGARRFHAGDYAGAVEQFSRAYDLSGDPSYLFNIAQAYRHAKDCVHSAEFYRRFLAEVPDPPNAAKIREWYVTEDLCARTKPAPVEPTLPATPVEPTLPSKIAPTPPPPAQHDHARPAIAPLVVVGGGLAGLVIGGGFALHARGIASDRDRALARCTLDTPCSAGTIADFDQRGARANTVAWVGVTAGAALVVAGAVWWRMSRRGDATVSLAPHAHGATVVGTVSW